MSHGLITVVLQPNARVCLAIVLDNITYHAETLWEMCVTHIAFERLWPRSLRTEPVSLLVVTSTVAWILYAALGLCVLSRPLGGLEKCLGFRPTTWMNQPVTWAKSEISRKLFLSQGVLLHPSAIRP
jgi:hypothetical protein